MVYAGLLCFVLVCLVCVGVLWLVRVWSGPFGCVLVCVGFVLACFGLAWRVMFPLVCVYVFGCMFVGFVCVDVFWCVGAFSCVCL